MRRSGDTFGRIQSGLVWSPRLKNGLIKARFTDSPFAPGECKEATARTPPLQPRRRGRRRYSHDGEDAAATAGGSNDI